MPDGEVEVKGPLAEPLTRREHQVLALLAEGYSGPEIAEHLPLAAATAIFSFPVDIAIDAEDNLYISDCGASLVLKVDQPGLLTVFAGTGALGSSGDGGPAVEAQLACPGGLAFDRDGNVYVADLAKFRIRRVDRNGIITTVVGTGADGYGGDGGPALAAQVHPVPSNGVSTYMGIAVAADGTVYISDNGNARVRRIDPQGIITTFAGDGGPATAAQLAWPADRAPLL